MCSKIQVDERGMIVLRSEFRIRLAPPPGLPEPKDDQRLPLPGPLKDSNSSGIAPGLSRYIDLRSP